MIFMIMNKEITDYFNTIKRQLRSLSENGGDPKKQSEEPSIVHDVFKKGLQNPDSLAILLLCLSNLETQANSIFKESADPKGKYN